MKDHPVVGQLGCMGLLPDLSEVLRALSKPFTVVIQPLSTRLIKPNFC